MIFKQAQQVLDGTKTQTRRPVKAGDFHDIKLPDGSFYAVTRGPDRRMKWKIFKTYAVQPGRGKKAVGRIRITKIRWERLREISFPDIKAEGVPREPLQRFAFEQLWNSLYRKPYRWEDNPEVWVLEFEPVKQ